MHHNLSLHSLHWLTNHGLISVFTWKTKNQKTQYMNLCINVVFLPPRFHLNELLIRIRVDRMVMSLVRPHSGIIAQLGFCFKSCSSPTGKMLLAHRSFFFFPQKPRLLTHSFPWICIKGNKIPYGATHSLLPFCEDVRLHIRSSLLWHYSELAFSYSKSCSFVCWCLRLENKFLTRRADLQHCELLCEFAISDI